MISEADRALVFNFTTIGPADSGAVMSYVTNYQMGAKAWSIVYFDLPAIPPDADAIKKLFDVIEAKVVEGPDLLRESALAAARLWVFRPTELAGWPVKVEDILTLKFAPR